MSRWDVVVVGAGPAGTSTAARLAGEGFRVLVLDREHFPRRKPCGECVNPAGVAALRALGAWSRVEALRPQPLAGWTIQSTDGSGFAGFFPDDRQGIAVARDVLDLALLEHAAALGATVRTGVRVADLVHGRTGVAGLRTVEGEVIRATVVVGADGLRSVVARRLGLPRRPPRLRKVALTAHLTGVRHLPPGRGELRASAAGCVGVARVGEDLANVTVVAGESQAEALAGDPAGFFDRTVASYGVAGLRVDDVLTTGPFDFPMRSVAVSGAILVGDAAGYFDPFTGQGIFRALRGGELAAEALCAALRSGDVSAAALAGYRRAHHGAFAPGERLQHLVEAFVARPRWLAWAARRLGRHAVLGDALIRATGDVIPPSRLLSPALLARLAF